jgi:hypothetical protein
MPGTALPRTPPRLLVKAAKTSFGGNVALDAIAVDLTRVTGPV